MPPEEQINREFWYVLKKIKTESLRTKKDHLIDYVINHTVLSVGMGIPTPNNEIKILEKIEELGAIKIIRDGIYQ